MKCLNCDTEVDVTLAKIEVSADEDGMEISFLCPGCNVEHFAILGPEDFAEVD